jgi:ABC-type nitrate/sulfonate/bicarbonate transport system ATPase subunit
MTASNDGSIVARGLGLLTPGGWVYREIDFDVPQGALALVTGPAGCGKTALLLTVAGRSAPAASSVSARPPVSTTSTRP